MITGKVEKTFELYGLSTDVKPTAGIDNGSIFIEIDLAKKYMFKDNYWEVSYYTTEEIYDDTKQYYPGDLVSDGATPTPTYYKCRCNAKGISPLVAENVGCQWYEV